MGFTGLYKIFGFDCCGECSTKCKPLTKVSGFSFYVMQLMLEYGELGTRTAAEPTATTTSAASGGSSEELLGPRPAIRKQGAADAGCRNPSACGGNREARLGPRSDFSRPRQGAVEKSVNATRQGGTPQIQLLGECLPGKLNPDSLQRGLAYFICILPLGRKDGTIK